LKSSLNPNAEISNIDYPDLAPLLQLCLSLNVTAEPFVNGGPVPSSGSAYSSVFNSSPPPSTARSSPTC
jgi:hypothetical protein